MGKYYLGHDDVSCGGFKLMWYRVHDGMTESVILNEADGWMFYLEDIDRGQDPEEFIRWFNYEADGTSGFSCGTFGSVLEALAECADPAVYWEARIECAVDDATEMNEVIEEMADDDRITDAQYRELYEAAIEPFRMENVAE